MRRLEGSRWRLRRTRMEIEWRFCGRQRLSRVGGKGSESARAGLSGGAGTGRGSRESWPEQVGRVGHEAPAHEIAGVRYARLGSGLAHGSMRSQSNCTVKTLPRH